jgi:MFS family permease
VAVFATYFANYAAMQLLSVARPRIAADLNCMPLYSWLIAVPSLASAFVTLLFGKLSDMYGRRPIMITSLAVFLVGQAGSALAQSFNSMIVAMTVSAFGRGAIATLCFAVLGDLFAPAERGRWAGLLNIPSGIAALAGPTISGLLVDTIGWRWGFWISIPIVAISLVTVLVGVPKLSEEEKKEHTIDYLGAVLLAVASSTMLLGFSWAGATYPWSSPVILGLFGTSIVFWVLFIRAEYSAEEPFLDPEVLTNRTFLTASFAGLFSLLGMMAILAYLPLFLQGVMGTSATLSGQIITPFSVLTAFMGVLAGMLIAKTEKYKWMYIVGYGILVGSMVLLVFLNAESPPALAWIVTFSAGLGLGTIPTINTLVVQYAVPRRLLGVATGGIYFFVMLGMAMAPAILGAALNTTYAGTLEAALPEGIENVAEGSVAAALNDPQILLSPAAMTDLRQACSLEQDGEVLFEQSVEAVRGALEAGLQRTFLIAAVGMVVSFLLILTIPQIPISKPEDMAPPPESEGQD